jgi:hypothetical protein
MTPFPINFLSQGLWRGTLVAVKSMFLPANISGSEKRERMAIMEAAISSALSHPNIVQTFTYSLRSVMTTPDVLSSSKGESNLAPPASGQQEGGTAADVSSADSHGIRALEVGTSHIYRRSTESDDQLLLTLLKERK